MAGRDHPRDHRPVGFLRQGRTRQGRTRRLTRRCARGSPVPSGRSSQRLAHPGPPTSHPRDPGQARPQDRPGLGGPSPAVDRTRAAAPRLLCEDVELPDRHRRRRGPDLAGLRAPAAPPRVRRSSSSWPPCRRPQPGPGVGHPPRRGGWASTALRPARDTSVSGLGTNWRSARRRRADCRDFRSRQFGRVPGQRCGPRSALSTDDAPRRVSFGPS